MKNKKTWRLPNGEETSNVKKMVKAWKDIYEPICKVTGASVVGYDPGILFRAPTFDLPTPIAAKISEMIKALKLVIKRNVGCGDTLVICKKALTPPPKPNPVKLPYVDKNFWGRKPTRKTKGIGGGWEKYKG